jgi:hypothetical protein
MICFELAESKLKPIADVMDLLHRIRDHFFICLKGRLKKCAKRSKSEIVLSELTILCS